MLSSTFLCEPNLSSIIEAQAVTFTELDESLTEEVAMIPNPSQDSDTAKCIKACFTCSRTCLETLQYCLHQKISKFTGKQLAILQFCADSCQTSAGLMMAEISIHHQSCELTFELCARCAEECERYQDDTIMARCAEECHRCADSCRGMAGMTVKMSSERGISP